MARKTMDLVHPDVLDLAGLLRPEWAARLAAIPAWHPRNEEPDPNPDPDPDPEPDPNPDPDPDPEPDWKQHSRKHEREAKKARKERDEFERKLKERDEADQTDHEKAVAKAREEAKAEAQAEVNVERRHDRLEVAATRIASTGLTVKVTEDGEEKDKVLKFADPDDALIYVDRAIKAGDVDEDDIFDSEGKVQTDALRTALQDILERKPHLQASGTNGAPRVSGSADGGKGSGAGKDEESLSVEERFERLQKTKK